LDSSVSITPPTGARPEVERESLAGLYERLHTSEQGLTGAEARARLAAVGPNDPVPAKRDDLLLQILSLFANPLVVILLLAAVWPARWGSFRSQRDFTRSWARS
jgi:magnesium-transporting ATPase (P-type)